MSKSSTMVDVYRYFLIFSLIIIFLHVLHGAAVADGGTGYIHNFAGGGTGGDGGQAVAASLSGPMGVAYDSSGSAYIADYSAHTIRKITRFGNISTIAGTAGSPGSTGDGGTARSALLNIPYAVAIYSGNIYIADSGNNKIRKIAADGKISTFAGDGTAANGADGVLATGTQLSGPRGVAVDSSGNVYIADYTNNRVRRVLAADGKIYNFVGSSAASPGIAPSGTTPLTNVNAKLRTPFGLAFDSSGNLYIAEYGNHRVSRVTSTTIYNYAGFPGPTVTSGNTGDVGPATSAYLKNPRGLAYDTVNNLLYIADGGNNRVRTVSGSNICNFAGNSAGTPGNTGDDGLGTSATMSVPSGVAVDPYGDVFIADNVNHRVRSVEGAILPSSTITSPAKGAYLGDTSPQILGTALCKAGSLTRVDVSTDCGVTWHTGGTNPHDTSTLHDWTSWGYDWTTPADGAYTIRSRAVDSAAHNEIPSGGSAVTVDNADPGSTITGPLDNAELHGPTCNISGTASDYGSPASGLQRVEVSTDGGSTWNPATGTTTWSYPWTLPSDRTTTIKSRAVDNAANAESPSTGVLVTVETTPPVTTITSPAPSAVVGGSLTISGTATDNGGSGVQKVELSLDGGSSWLTASGATSWSLDCTTPALVTSFTITAKATDIFGRVETPGTGVTVNVDRTSPSASIHFPRPGTTLKGASRKFTGVASDSGGAGVLKVEVSTDNSATWHAATDKSGGAWSSWEYTWAPLPLSAHSIVVEARATDKVLNVQSPSANTVVHVDNAPPASTILSPADGGSIAGLQYLITGTCSDGTGSGVQKVEVSFNGGTTWVQASGTTSWSYNWTLPADDYYTIMVRATDNMDNAETPWPNISVTVDNTRPTSAIGSPAGGATLNGTGCTITGTAWDNVGVEKVEVNISGDPAWHIASGTDSWSYAWTLPADGTYTVKSRSTDITSNAQTTDYSMLVHVDNNPPTSAIGSPAGGATLNGTSATITGTASDGTGTGVQKVEVGITPNGGSTTWTRASGTTSWSYLWNFPPISGSYTVSVRATDNASHVETPVSIQVNTDIPTTITSLMPGVASPAFTGTPVLWTVTGSGGSGSYQFKFLLRDPAGVWTTVKDYTVPGNTWNWTPVAAGKYQVVCYMRNTGSTASYEAYVNSGWYTVNWPPAVLASLTPGVASPAFTGNPVLWTATGSGGSGNYQFKFLLRDPAGVWTTVKDYTVGNNTWNWTPTAPGKYQVVCYVRNAGSTASYDAYINTGWYTVNWPPAQLLSLAPSVASPALTGSPVVWTATGSGGSGSYEFKFMLRDPAGVWTTVKDYNVPGNTWNWVPVAPGKYQVVGYVRNAGSTAAYDAYINTGWYTVNWGPAQITSLTPSLSTPSAIGHPVIWTAAATGGSGSYEYKFMLRDPAGVWTTVKDYNVPGNTWNWAPAAVGNYQVACYVRKAGTTVNYDTYLNPGWYEVAYSVWTWGRNTGGALGDGTTTSRYSPVNVSGLSGVVDIAGGYYHTLALKSDHTVMAWGSNTYGQVGDASNTDRLTPVPVSGLTGITDIDAGVLFSMARKNDGTVYAWGDNEYGQLGDTTTNNSNVPVQVSVLSGITVIAASGSSQGVALKDDNTVWTWGRNDYGQLGKGTIDTDPHSTPSQVTTISGIIKIAAGGGHTIVLKSNGSVWSWGLNTDGQLGNSSNTNSPDPVQAVGLTTGVIAIAGGNYHTVALKSDGTVWTWGRNDFGQLGRAGTANEPGQVSGLTDVVEIAAGGYFTMARKSDGTVWMWGKDQYGELGVGTADANPHTLPTQVTGLTNVIAIAGGGPHAMAVK